MPHWELACEWQTFLLAHCRWGTFREEERLRLSDRNSILMTQNLSGIRSEALIGRRSRFIVLAIVYKWQIKDKRPPRSNVNAMNLWQNSQYLWNIVFSKSSIWVLLQLIRRWTQHFTKIDQEKRKIEQICIWNPMTTGFIYVNIDLRHQYGISVAKSQTFLLAKCPSAAMSEEKRLSFAG